MLILPHHGCRPEISSGVFLAPNAIVIGEVRIGCDSSIWFNAVVRADVNSINIGERSNLQDGVVVHVASLHATSLGCDVTVGHNAVLHGCRVEDGCLVGMQATVLDGAVVGAHSLVAAGAVVAPGTIIPPGSLVMGAPARVKRPLTTQEQENLMVSAANYVDYTQDYLSLMETASGRDSDL